ncbi:hypothetical protein GLOIN_2v1599680 [Rhizophagus clarus]|nr:hypothetical protein GLOIN_2v1599680 [Rhizophagus clarus]
MNDKNEFKEDKDKLDNAKSSFLKIINSLDNSEQIKQFYEFVKNILDKEIKDIDEFPNGFTKYNVNNVLTLENIKDKLRNKLSITTEAPDENIVIPKTIEYEGYTKETTVNVDAFLYSDKDVEELGLNGQLKNYFCNDCGSKNIESLNFISHSTSMLQLQYIFGHVLNGIEIDDKIVLDIGSRLGCVLYVGYLFSPIKKLIGIELNQFFADLQKEIIQEFNMNDRVEIIQDDITNHPQLLQTADIIIMNNVFQFFHSLPVQQAIWSFIRANTKPSTLIITFPDLKGQLDDANCTNIDFDKWVKEITIKIPYKKSQLTEDEWKDLKLIHLYKVL